MSKPKVMFIDYTCGNRFPGIDLSLTRLNSEFDYVWDDNVNKDSSTLLNYDFENHFLTIIHPGEDENGDNNLKHLFGSEVVLKTMRMRYGFIYGYPHAVSGLIDYYQDELDDAMTDSGTFKDLHHFVDFKIAEFPSVEDLDELIRRSYNKYI